MIEYGPLEWSPVCNDLMYYWCLIFRYSIVLFSTEMSIDLEVLGGVFSDNEEEARPWPHPCPAPCPGPGPCPNPGPFPRPLIRCKILRSSRSASATRPRPQPSWSWPFSTKCKFTVFKSLSCNVFIILLFFFMQIARCRVIMHKYYYY